MGIDRRFVSRLLAEIEQHLLLLEGAREESCDPLESLKVDREFWSYGERSASSRSNHSGISPLGELISVRTSD